MRRALLAFLLLFALALRVLTPAGYMPSGLADGAFLQLCSSLGVVSADPSAHDPAPGPDGKAAKCAFGTVQPLDTSAPLQALLAVRVVYLAAIRLAPPGPSEHDRRLAAPPPPSHAPPRNLAA